MSGGASWGLSLRCPAPAWSWGQGFGRVRSSTFQHIPVLDAVRALDRGPLIPEVKIATPGTSSTSGTAEYRFVWHARSSRSRAPRHFNSFLIIVRHTNEMQFLGTAPRCEGPDDEPSGGFRAHLPCMQILAGCLLGVVISDQNNGCDGGGQQCQWHQAQRNSPVGWAAAAEVCLQAVRYDDRCTSRTAALNFSQCWVPATAIYCCVANDFKNLRMPHLIEDFF